VEDQHNKAQVELAKVEGELSRESSSEKRTCEEQQEYWEDRKKQGLKQKQTVETRLLKNEEAVQRLQIENEELLKEQASLKSKIAESERE
jgi:hypothetical protein